MYKKRLILFAISLLLIGFLFSRIDYGEFFRVTSRLSFQTVSALLLIQAVIMFLMALKWYVIIRRYAVSFKNVFYTSLIGSMVNNLTPASVVGGEPVKAYILSRIDNVKMENAIATVFVDLYITILPILLLNLLAIVLVFTHSFDLRLAWALALVGLFIISLIIAASSILLNREPSLKLLNRLMESAGRIRPLRRYTLRLEAHLDEIFLNVHHSIRDTMTDTRTLALGTTISAAVWALSVFRVWVIFQALDVPIDLSILIIVYTVMVTVGILPLLPGALGMWELVGAGLFTFFGIPLEASVAVVVVDRILFFWLPIATGFLASLHIGLNVKSLVGKEGNSA
jgi:glycosyltransferase 2 family protein